MQGIGPKMFSSFMALIMQPRVFLVTVNEVFSFKIMGINYKRLLVQHNFISITFSKRLPGHMVVTYSFPLMPVFSKCICKFHVLPIRISTKIDKLISKCVRRAKSSQDHYCSFIVSARGSLPTL